MIKHTLTATTYEDVTMLRGHILFLGHHFTYCTYYVDGLLIDCGPSSARKKLMDWLSGKRLDKIILTHHHEDHTGNAAFLSDFFNVPVYMSASTKEELSDRKEIPLYRKLIWGQQETSPIGNIQLAEKEIQTNKHRFHIISTPGHTNDHLSLIEPESKWVFSGDLYLGKRLLYGMKGESVPTLIRSIENVLQYPFQTIFCGHAGIVEDGYEALLAKKEFLTELTNKTLYFKHQGYTTKQITEKVLPKQQLVEIFTLGEMSPAHLIKSII